MAKTIKEPVTSTTVENRDRAIRQNVLAKSTTKNPARVDIKAVGPNRFRVNIWREFGNGMVSDYRIVESFYHVELTHVFSNHKKD